MLESWPISRRVGSGFLILTCMLIGLALFSQRSVDRLANGYSEYRLISQQYSAVSAAVSNLMAASGAASDFRLTADPNRRDAVISNVDDVLNNAELRNSFEASPSHQSDVERLLVLTAEYKSSFLTMADQLAQAHQLRADNRAQSEAITDNANAIFTAAVQNGNPPIVSAAGRSLQAALSAVVQSKQVALSGSQDDLDQFNAFFEDFNRTMRRLKAIATVGTLPEQIDALAITSDGYDRNVNQLAQIERNTAKIQTETLDAIAAQVSSEINTIRDYILARQKELGPQGTSIVEKLEVIIPVVGILAVIIAVLASVLIARWITASIRRLADTTDRLAAGENDIIIGGAEHAHELGRMAKALHVFRDAQVDRAGASAERAKLRDQQNAVVNTMKSELAQLADGDLTTQINEIFAPEYEELRHNFNAAINALQTAMARMTETSLRIGTASSDSQTATTELSQRTENQAATLEETAAALDELTASVKSAAEHAKSVDDSVARARSEATRNGEIVAQAVSAMDEIEHSSKKISQVIGVIDDIAFQTNLLALNAGVEAARAGESGRGFAVVASEVRALAQRSAEAAKEISGLIANSSQHVTQGTQLVGNAGEALSEIIAQVNDISSMTSQIATSAEEQAIGLSEINLGVNQLDKVTQQNAAMVQDSMVRGDSLATEANNLSLLIGNFKLVANGVQKHAPADKNDILADAIAGTHRPLAPPQEEPKRIAAATGNNQAMWEDY